MRYVCKYKGNPDWRQGNRRRKSDSDSVTATEDIAATVEQIHRL